ncbi:DUF4260 domain-containing protein [Mesorhizobium sp. KR9-304]|uniref:DUF4260 domain-containing protein n=1 Tax=Mesorhizobium sp. KR9-304 TaxID=3156614 RepID=UPI0032B54DA5
MLAAAVAAYVLADGSWQLFVLLILAPDLAMLGYLAGPAAGAILYNAFHILVWPVILLFVGFWADNPIAIQVAAIWIAHIAMDRALGYGLKLPTGFSDTHLGRIGKGR